MQTYAVVDCEFKFVKIGRTGDLESRLATLNTASPIDLVLMALFDGDIEQEMHRCLDHHRKRLEWFHYNDDTESTIVARMSPTSEWFKARSAERKRRKKDGCEQQMGPVPMGAFTALQRDRMSGVVMESDRRFRYDPFDIPSDEYLVAAIARRQKSELLDLRRLLSACGTRAREEIRALSKSPDPTRLAAATFALSVVKNWKRRVGMELGSLMVKPTSDS